VADVARVPGVREQLRLVAWLRWMMLKNGLRRKNTRWDLVGIIVAGIFSSLLILGLSLAFYGGTVTFLRRHEPEWLSLLFWAIFLWWQMVPIFVAGFGANFSFRNLLRFPLSLRTFYILGMGYGFADFAAFAALFWIASMLVGVARARPSLLVPALFICLLFVLLNVTMERLIGSWLEKLLANRRVREFMVGLFVVSMVSLNFLNPAMHHWEKDQGPPAILRILPYLAWLPGSLAGNFLASAAHLDAAGQLLGIAGLGLWLAAASFLLWRRYRLQYLGEELSEGTAPSLHKRSVRRVFSGTEGPTLLSPSIIGVVEKEFHYLTRNGFTLLQLVLPPALVVVFSMQFAGTHSALKEHGLSPQNFYPAIMAYLILILISPAYNSFAYEGYGIQTYFLAPVRMREVLVGKNVFLVGLVATELAISLLVLIWRIGFPGFPLFFSTVMAAVFGVAGQLTIANWSALSFPKKMEIGKMKGQRNSGIAVWTAFGVQILVGGIATLVLFAGRWTDSPWLPVILFLALTVAAMGGYMASLDPLSRLAEEKKELLIETLCK
jgi:ABC-2 type transport system permease protein